jgi:hypothetical protein
MFKNYLLALLVFNLSACATVHSVSLPSPGTVPSNISTGDRVEVITLDDEKHKFSVTRIDSSGIGSHSEFYLYTDIKRIGLRQANNDVLYKVLVVAGVAFAVAASVNGISSAGRAVGCTVARNCP